MVNWSHTRTVKYQGSNHNDECRKLKCAIFMNIFIQITDLWAKPLMFSAQFGTESPAASHVATPISVLHTFSEVLVG